MIAGNRDRNMRLSTSHQTHPDAPTVPRAKTRRERPDQPNSISKSPHSAPKRRKEDSLAAIEIEWNGKFDFARNRLVSSERCGRARGVTWNLRAGQQRALGATPVEHYSFACSAQIVYRDRDERVFPLHILNIDLERAEIGRRKFCRERHLCAKNRRIVNASM